jgi:hypothetical protein
MSSTTTRPCPKCGTEVPADATRCKQCFAKFEPTAIKQRPSVPIDPAPPSLERTALATANKLPPTPSTPTQSSLTTRYTDAYLVARTINGLGEGIKVIGFVLGGLIALAGLVAASNLSGALSLGSLLLGAVVALPLYVLGVLVSAQGQILKATLDTAVNSSPLLSHDEIRHILTL